MAAYIIAREITITRQEGDTGTLDFTLPAVLNPANYDIYFAVFDSAGEKIIDKQPADFVKSGQTVTTNLSEADTAGLAGKYRWELEIVSPSEVHTIGRGNFIITQQLITDVRH